MVEIVVAVVTVCVETQLIGNLVAEFEADSVTAIQGEASGRNQSRIADQVLQLTTKPIAEVNDG